MKPKDLDRALVSDCSIGHKSKAKLHTHSNTFSPLMVSVILDDHTHVCSSVRLVLISDLMILKLEVMS